MAAVIKFQMNENEIINKAIQELKSNEKPYLMFKDFSVLNGINPSDDRYQKIHYLIKKSPPFEMHTENAIKFSTVGFDVANNHKDWFAYNKTLKPKTDYVKWIGVGIAGISLIWNIYQGVTNSQLRNENRSLGNEIEALEKNKFELKE